MLIPRYTLSMMERITNNDTKRRSTIQVGPSHNTDSRHSHNHNMRHNNRNLSISRNNEAGPSNNINNDQDNFSNSHINCNNNNGNVNRNNSHTNITNNHSNNHSNDQNNRSQQPPAVSPKITNGKIINNNDNENSSQSENESDVEGNNDDVKSNCSNSPSKHNSLQCKTRERIAEQYYCLAMDELRLYEHFLAQLLLATLKRVGVCVLKNFLPATLAESVHGEIKDIFSTTAATAETKLTTKGNLKYRTDEVAWVGADDAKYKCIHKLSHTFRRLIVSTGRLNELRPHRFKITHQSHLQVSRFPKGCSVGYKPHIENPNKNGRLLSVAYFTNKDYTRIADNGQVRFYLNDDTKYVEVEPSFNTAVIYWSDRRVIKEVLPSDTKDLYHITSWFFGSCTIK